MAVSTPPHQPNRRTQDPDSKIRRFPVKLTPMAASWNRLLVQAGVLLSLVLLPLLVSVQNPALGIGIGTLLLLGVTGGIVYRLVHDRSPWKPVAAICIKRLVHACETRDACSLKSWTFDVDCRFTWKGISRVERLHPNDSLRFLNAESANRYLDQAIDAEGRCILWIHKDSPDRLTFHTAPSD